MSLVVTTRGKAVGRGELFALWPAPFAGEDERRWEDWKALQVPTLAIFCDDWNVGETDKEELIRRRPWAERFNLVTGSHDAHLDAFDEWIDALRGWLLPSRSRAAPR